MIEVPKSKMTPFHHQLVGIEKLIVTPYLLLGDEMGIGKTKQVIDAAQVMFELGLLDRVLVICPAAVRAVWFDEELGELKKHLWDGLPASVNEYHAKPRRWVNTDKVGRKLAWLITNYDYIRSKARLEQILPYCNQKTLLVLDESSCVKNHAAQQTKACLQIRRACGRVVLLNGTPVSNSPGDMYSQANILNPNILGCKSYFHFVSKYGIRGGWQNKQIIKWTNIEDLQLRLKPFVLRRLKEDCLDLPAKLPSVTLTATLTPEVWNVYKDMKDEMVAWLSDQTVSVAAQAIVKTIRLAQVTSGFLGGVQTQTLVDFDAPEIESRPAWLPGLEAIPDTVKSKSEPILQTEIKEIGREKLDVFLDWYKQCLGENPDLKVLVWCRFRAELYRLVKELEEKGGILVGAIVGGQKRGEREAALRLLDPRTMPKGPAVVVGTPASGSMGLNLTGAHTVVYMSNDYSMKTRLQSEDRVHRPGQLYPVSYYDIIAVGPNGQKTIDHTVIKALRNKVDLATFTTSAWLAELRD